MYGSTCAPQSQHYTSSAYNIHSSFHCCDSAVNTCPVVRVSWSHEWSCSSIVTSAACPRRPTKQVWVIHLFLQYNSPLHIFLIQPTVYLSNLSTSNFTLQILLTACPYTMDFPSMWAVTKIMAFYSQLLLKFDKDSSCKLICYRAAPTWQKHRHCSLILMLQTLPFLSLQFFYYDLRIPNYLFCIRDICMRLMHISQ